MFDFGPVKRNTIIWSPNGKYILLNVQVTVISTVFHCYHLLRLSLLFRLTIDCHVTTVTTVVTNVTSVTTARVSHHRHVHCHNDRPNCRRCNHCTPLSSRAHRFSTHSHLLKFWPTYARTQPNWLNGKRWLESTNLACHLATVASCSSANRTSTPQRSNFPKGSRIQYELKAFSQDCWCRHLASEWNSPRICGFKSVFDFETVFLNSNQPMYLLLQNFRKHV